MHEISTPEVAEVFAVNSIAPFVLAARLKPLMARQTTATAATGVSATATTTATGSADGDLLDICDVAVNTRAFSLAGAKLTEANLTADEESRSCRGEKKGFIYGSACDTSQITSAKKRVSGTGGRASLSDAEICAGVGVGAPENTESGGSSGSPAVRGADCSFVVNVSSMEGKFYRKKMATHPHTNMAKAAMNMMTRTSAADYASSGIYMTAVDTGAPTTLIKCELSVLLKVSVICFCVTSPSSSSSLACYID